MICSSTPQVCSFLVAPDQRLIHSEKWNMVSGMIKSFRCRDTKLLANDERKRFKAIERIARRKLEMLAWPNGLRT